MMTRAKCVVFGLLLSTLALPAMAQKRHHGRGESREHWRGAIRHFHQHDIARRREGRWVHGVHAGRHGWW